jgi:hypothetical protein
MKQHCPQHPRGALLAAPVSKRSGRFSVSGVLACCLTYPHRGNISARSALAGQGAGGGGRGRVAAARFALLCQCSPPTTTTAIARPRSGPYCRLSTDLLLFAFVHAGCAHVPLASRTSQRLTSVYLTFVHSQSLQPCPPPPAVRCQHLPRRYHPLHWTCRVGLLVTEVLLSWSASRLSQALAWHSTNAGLPVCGVARVMAACL